MFALVVRFDLRPGTEDEFDRLVEETTGRIRADEPGTLRYLCHGLSDDKWQRKTRWLPPVLIGGCPGTTPTTGIA